MTKAAATVGDAIEHVVAECEERCLQGAAGWLSELALGAPDSLLDAEAPYIPSTNVEHSVEPLSSRKRMRLALARAHFNNQEFLRCQHLLTTALASTEAAAAAAGDASFSTIVEGDDEALLAPAGSTSPFSEQRTPKNVFADSNNTPEHQQFAGNADESKNASTKTKLHILLQQPPVYVFLALYSLYMESERAFLPVAQTSGSKNKVPASDLEGDSAVGALGGEQSRQRGVLNATGSGTIRAIDDIIFYASHALQQYPRDAYLHWLCGVAQLRAGRLQDATRSLFAAVTHNPLFRSAWVDLQTLITREQELVDLHLHLSHLPFSFMRRIFTATVKTKVGCSLQEAKQDWISLVNEFPEVPSIRAMLANTLYEKKELEAARANFMVVRTADPYRIEGVDELSNLLFLQGDSTAICQVAQHAYEVNPYRAESNSAVANYYAHLKRHDRAILHFRRAVAIDPANLSAWTLLGHSYMELRNPQAAAEAYRTAVEIDPRAFRAWYGLGQIYELLQMHHYALHYYWQTTVLRPKDPRMWLAVANCLHQQHRVSERISCLQRAEALEPQVSDDYRNVVKVLAEALLECRRSEQAAVYLEKLSTAAQATSDDLVFAFRHLADIAVQQLNTLLCVPTNRSPSFEPGVMNVGGGAAGMSMPRASDAAKKEEANRLLGMAESYVARLQTLPAAPGGVAAEQQPQQEMNVPGSAAADRSPPITPSDMDSDLARHSSGPGGSVDGIPAGGHHHHQLVLPRAPTLPELVDAIAFAKKYF